jgi:hypothetical protein
LSGVHSNSPPATIIPRSNSGGRGVSPQIAATPANYVALIENDGDPFTCRRYASGKLKRRR